MKTLFLIASAPLLLVAGCNRPASETAAPATDTSATTATPASGEMARTATGDTDATPLNAPAPAGTPTDSASYVAMAGAGDLFEIQSSNTILGKSPSPAVRDFANMMIAHHKDATAKVTAAAKQAGMTVPPPALMPDQQRMLADIEGASGTNAETVYLAHQRTAHEKSLNLNQTYANSGETPALREVAAGIVPVVQSHIDALAKIMPQ